MKLQPLLPVKSLDSYLTHIFNVFSVCSEKSCQEKRNGKIASNPSTGNTFTILSKCWSMISQDSAECSSTRLKSTELRQEEKKKIPQIPKSVHRTYISPVFFSLCHVVISDQGQLLWRPRSHSRLHRRVLPGKKRSPVTPAFLMGAEQAASGQRCHGRLSMARRALSLFSWKFVCVRARACVQWLWWPIQRRNRQRGSHELGHAG